MRRGVVGCVQELRDRNDELSSELELLTSQRSSRKSRRASGGDDDAVLNWTQPALSASVESDSGKHQHRPCVSVCLSVEQPARINHRKTIFSPGSLLQGDLQ